MIFTNIFHTVTFYYSVNWSFFTLANLPCVYYIVSKSIHIYSHVYIYVCIVNKQTINIYSPFITFEEIILNYLVHFFF